MSDLLLGLADRGLGWTLFVIAVGVNVYQYRIGQKLQDKRLEDWQTVLNTTNDLAKSTSKSQESAAVMINGIDSTLKIILERMSYKHDK